MRSALSIAAHGLLKDRTTRCINSLLDGPIQKIWPFSFHFRDALLGTTQEIAQIYRRINSSAMTNLNGLERGYWQFYKLVKSSNTIDTKDLNYLKKRIFRIMMLSYLRQLGVMDAVLLIVNFVKNDLNPNAPNPL